VKAIANSWDWNNVIAPSRCLFAVGSGDWCAWQLRECACATTYHRCDSLAIDNTSPTGLTDAHYCTLAPNFLQPTSVPSEVQRIVSLTLPFSHSLLSFFFSFVRCVRTRCVWAYVCVLSLIAFTFSPRCRPVAGNWSAGRRTGATTSRTN